MVELSEDFSGESEGARFNGWLTYGWPVCSGTKLWMLERFDGDDDGDDDDDDDETTQIGESKFILSPRDLPQQLPRQPNVPQCR